jgi:molybdenum cofactor sulfurtransferase
MYLNSKAGVVLISYFHYFFALCDIGNNWNLFAFPSECNFSGQKFNLNLVKLIKEGKVAGFPSQQQ